MVQALVENCLRAGVKHFVCSPGSRNASIVIALDEHPEVMTYVVHDERCAAFVAMGMALQLQAPVACVCTSGSAMLNYYPAVAEAFYQRIPLVVISADRPEKWINQGDGQTIVQKGVYSNHIDGETSLTEEMSKKEVEEALFHLFAKINGGTKGPLHINVALNEPLYDTQELALEKTIPFDFLYNPMILGEEEKVWIKEQIQGKKVMVLVGQKQHDLYFVEQLKQIADDPSFAILVENTANAIFYKWNACIDRTLAAISEEELADYAPDVLFTFGGAVVSKKIKAYLRKYAPKVHLKIGWDFPEMDTYEVLTKSYAMNEGTFLNQLMELKQELLPSNYGGKWKQKDLIAEDKALHYLEGIPFCDLKAHEIVLDCIPEHSVVHLGNSTVIRYAQLFNPVQGITYHSNRGTSGIDGSLSTAVGAALADPDHLHVAVVGDVSFFYDSNFMWLNYRIPNLRVVLVNNGGGAIFNYIPGPRTAKQREKYFEAKHDFQAEYLCKSFNVEYFTSREGSEIENQMDDFLSYTADGHIKLLEIHTSVIENHLFLDRFFEFIQK